MLFALTVVLVLGSCDKAGRVIAPTAAPSAATSPEQAVRALEWAFVNRDADVLEGLFSSDLLFVTAVDDSAGNSQGESWNRERLLRTLRTLFEGDPTGAPAAAKLTLSFDRTLRAAADTRPGMADSTHQAIRTSIDFQVVTDEGSVIDTNGHVLFYLTRGDAAVLPAGASGDPPPASSARWWISRIDDETLPLGALAPQPSRNTTLGEILRLYWNPR